MLFCNNRKKFFWLLHSSTNSVFPYFDLLSIAFLHLSHIFKAVFTLLFLLSCFGITYNCWVVLILTYNTLFSLLGKCHLSFYLISLMSFSRYCVLLAFKLNHKISLSHLSANVDSRKSLCQAKTQPATLKRWSHQSSVTCWMSERGLGPWTSFLFSGMFTRCPECTLKFLSVRACSDF